MLDNDCFYDKASSFYDEMINFEAAFDNRKILLNNFLTNEIVTAADIGCGTGLDSIALASKEIAVTGFDPSTNMLNKAAVNARQYKAKVDFKNYSILNIPQEYYHQFSLVLSLGNTFANVPSFNLASAVNNLYKLADKNGLVLIQILNFERILRDKERIINITESESKFYIRFYDFLENYLNFNIINFEKHSPRKREFITTKLYPYSANDVVSCFQSSGFINIELFGSLAKEQFQKNTSTDLVVFARK